jgi:outer membrane protein assembly factor BamB
LGEARAARFAAIEKINGGGAAGPAMPAEFAEDGGRAAAGDGARFAGPLPYDAPWYGNASLAGLAKFQPCAFGDRILLASWKNVGMYREDGRAIWTATNPKAPGAFYTDRSHLMGRGGNAAGGAAFAPAVLCDVYGRPAVVVVRQPTVAGEAGFSLRALSAADGRTLWSTESNESRKALAYVGLPAVAGRYVYAVGLTRTGYSTGNLCLCALDVMTGETLWQTTLGAATEQGDRFGAGGGKRDRGAAIQVEAFAELTEPTVARDLVVVSPNCGAVVAVGRFDGKIRWAHPYRTAAGAAVPVPAARHGGRRDADEDVRSALRYRSTPAVWRDVVLALPADAPSLMALDLTGGKLLWDNALFEENDPPYAIAGVAGDVVVLAGATLRGLDVARGGRAVWPSPRDARPARLTGPAVVVGQTVLAPTASGVVQLSAADGKERPTYAAPSFRKFLATPSGRAAVEEAGATRSVGAR